MNIDKKDNQIPPPIPNNDLTSSFSNCNINTMQLSKQPSINNIQNNNKIIPSPVEVSAQQISELQLNIQNIQLQINKLYQFQEQTYQWNLKHHENMKKIIKSFNTLNTFIKQSKQQTSQIKNKKLVNNKKEGKKSDNIDAEEKRLPEDDNNILFIEKKSTMKSPISYHSRIMECYKSEGYKSEQLFKLIENMDTELFLQLEEESIEIILPVLLKFQQESNQMHLIAISLITLWMVFEKFPHFFSKRKYSDIMSQFNLSVRNLEETGAINQLETENMFPFTPEEYNLLKKILDKDK